MNEFEWLRQTRALKHPVTPRRDLWDGIAARLPPPVPATSTTRPSRWLPLAMAATLAALSVLAGSLAWQQTPQQMPATRIASTTIASWKPDDPRLAGAAIELHSAQLELTRAIREQPDNAWLHRMLEFTRHKQQTLQQLEHVAS